MLPCRKCGAALEVRPEHIGRKIKCAACGAEATVAAAEKVPAEKAGGESTRLPPMRTKPAAAAETPATPSKPAAAQAKRCPRCNASLQPDDVTCAKCGCELALASLVLSDELHTAPAASTTRKAPAANTTRKAPAATTSRKPRGLEALTPKQRTLLFSGAGVGLVALVAIIWVSALPSSGGRAGAKVAQGERSSNESSKSTSTATKNTETPKPRPKPNIDFSGLPDVTDIEWKPKSGPKSTPTPTPKPTPTEPKTTEPTPTELAKTEPTPTEPKTTEPKPTEPTPTEPKPTEPKPTEPKTTEPKTTEPKPTELAKTEPKPTEPKPTEPTTTDPTPTEPTPTEPTTTEPTPTEPKPKTKPKTKPKPTPPVPASGQTSYASWIQDPEAANRQAADEDKDILMVFVGSDWDGESMRMTYEVFFKKEFHDWAAGKFVLMVVDFPQNPPAKAAVQNPARNANLARELGVERQYPAVVLTDAQRRPYGRLGYIEGVPTFIASAGQMLEVRRQRDILFQEVARAKAAAKLVPARKAVELLQKDGLSRFYEQLLDEWFALSVKYDAKNQAGAQEFFFGARWMARMAKASKQGADAMVKTAAELTDWQKTHRFLDPNRGAKLHLIAARCLSLANKDSEAVAHIKEGLACQPTDPGLLATLKSGSAALEGGDGSGTGFVVSPDGYLLSNFHVVRGAEQKIVVRLPGLKQPAPAKVVAKDEERDMALLKITVPAGMKLPALRFANAEPGRGARIAVFGYPLGDAVGATIKLTTGTVSAIGDEGTEGMCVIDCRVNPGNSGGPLCDVRGHVVGMVTAKSRGGYGVESYGMAIPITPLREFLTQNLPNKAKGLFLTSKGRNMEWVDVDRIVSPSVLMIIRNR